MATVRIKHIKTNAYLKHVLKNNNNTLDLSLSDVVAGLDVPGLGKEVHAYAFEVVYGDLVSKVNSELNTTRKAYSDSIKVVYEDGTVTQNKSKTKIGSNIRFDAKPGSIEFLVEYGQSPYDMRDVLLKNIIIDKEKGQKYRSRKIPFSFLTSGYGVKEAGRRKVGANNILNDDTTNAIKSILKDSPNTKQIGGKLFASKGIDTSALFKPNHTTGILNNLLVGKNSKATGKYGTIRTISDNPAKANKWQSKGIKAHNFFKRVMNNPLSSADITNFTENWVQTKMASENRTISFR